jgi:hypothetical protein
LRAARGLYEKTLLTASPHQDRHAGEYNISRIGFNQWQALASACGIDSEMLMNRVRQLADALPDAITAARDQALADGLNREVVTTLTDLLILHARARRATLNAAASRRRRSRKIVAEN